jgi:hypothetical protein
MAQEPQAQSIQTSVVDQLVDDPGAPPELAVFIGYPGRSSREEHHRLYLAADLSDFLDVPNKAVRQAYPVPPEVDPLGAVYLWVHPDAPLVRGRRGAAGLARYCAFDIAQHGIQPQVPVVPWGQPAQQQAGYAAGCMQGAGGWQPGQYQTQAPYLCGYGGQGPGPRW